MKVVVTGSNGLLGQKLIELLVNKPDVTLVAVSRGDNRARIKEGYSYISCDFMEPNALAQVLEKEQPNALIHTAALTNVDACETQVDECQRLNVDLVQEIVDWVQGTTCHLLHLSTDFVFDGKNGPYSEGDEMAALSQYGKSKELSERIVQNAGLQNWSIARTIIVYGVCAEMSRSNLVLWAKQAAEKGTPLTVVNDQFRSPTLAEDLAQGCWSILDKKASGIYHLGGPETTSVFELVSQVFAVFGGDLSLLKSSSSAELGQPANRPPKTGLIIEKARKDLDYQPLSFKEGLERVKTQLEK